MSSLEPHVKLLLLTGLGIAVISVSVFFIFVAEAEKKDKYVTFQVNFDSAHPEEIDGRFFVKKGSDWFLYSMLQHHPFWLDVGTIEQRDGMIFKQVPDITHLAIQYWVEGNVEIVNIKGDGNFTTNLDIDGDKKSDFVFIKEVKWDDSLPKEGWEFRTNSIIADVEVKPLRSSMEKMKMDIETIIYIEKNYPDYLTDEEVDILLSYSVGRGYGIIDPEVDSKALDIMFKLVEEGILDE